MAQYFLDLTQPDQDILDQFTVNTTDTNGRTVFQVVTDLGERALNLIPNNVAASGSTGTVVATWDAAGANSGKTQVLTYQRAPYSSNVYANGPTARTTVYDSYASVDRSPTSGSQYLNRNDGSGTRVNLSTAAGQYATGDAYHWRLLEVEGSTIRHVAWDGAYADKPVAWDAEVVDATYPTGFCGLYNRCRGSTDTEGLYVQLLSVGTDGDPAPDTGVAPPVGVKEMYVKDGGTFKLHTPYVKVGGAFQEVDAYVKSGGVWVPVHEK